MMPNDFDQVDLPQSDELGDDDEGFDFDCGMDRNGQCSMAGSEHCEFECPIMASVRKKRREKA